MRAATSLLRLAALLFLAWLCGAPAVARAQQTVFNDPSADALGRGDVYLELDGTQRFHQGFEGLTPRLVVGLGVNVEAGLNIGPFFGNGAGGPLTATPNAKLALRIVEGDWGALSAAAGTRVYVPLHDGSVSVEGYGLAAYNAPFGARVTAGLYGETGSPGAWGPTATLEVPLFEHLTVAGEWWRGRDLGAGLVIALPAQISLYTAYLFSPLGRDHDGVVVELGKTF